MTLIPGWKRREFLKVGTTTTVAVAAGAMRARARETETSGGHRHVATRRHDARGGVVHAVQTALNRFRERLGLAPSFVRKAWG